MAILELVRQEPNWFSALEAALTRPPDVPERRAGEDPWEGATVDRPRRASDDLAWLRQAFDRPESHGMKYLSDTAAVAAWEVERTMVERLCRLRDRGILDAGGFLLHEPDMPPVEAA